MLLTGENNSCHPDAVVRQVVIFLWYAFQDWWLYYQHGNVKLKEISQEDAHGEQQLHSRINSAEKTTTPTHLNRIRDSLGGRLVTRSSMLKFQCVL